MDLKYFFQEQAIDPQAVLVMRHTPSPPSFARVLPWLAAEQPDLFNAYQRTQRRRPTVRQIKRDPVMTPLPLLAVRSL